MQWSRTVLSHLFYVLTVRFVPAQIGLDRGTAATRSGHGYSVKSVELRNLPSFDGTVVRDGRRSFSVVRSNLYPLAFFLLEGPAVRAVKQFF